MSNSDNRKAVTGVPIDLKTHRSSYWARQVCSQTWGSLAGSGFPFGVPLKRSPQFGATPQVAKKDGDRRGSREAEPLRRPGAGREDGVELQRRHRAGGGRPRGRGSGAFFLCPCQGDPFLGGTVFLSRSQESLECTRKPTKQGIGPE